MDVAGVLYKINRWWATGKVDPGFLFRTSRDELGTIMSHMSERRILSLTGPRRVGKSTLLLQAVDKLLRNGVEPKRLLFFSGDEPAFLVGKIGLSSILDAYFEDVLNQAVEDIDSKTYIFIDEVHSLDDWQVHLKSFYDKRADIKFIVSGSSAPRLFMDSRESLLGRIDDLYVLPLNLRQFALFSCIYGDNSLDLEGFRHLLPAEKNRPFDEPGEYFESLWRSRHELNAYEARFAGIVKDYLLAGGYPEYFETKNIAVWQKRLSGDVVQRGLYRDIVSAWNVKNPEILERLLYYIAGGGEHSYTSIAGALGVDVSTASSYVNYLSQAFLTSVCENYSPNASKVVRKNKKLYISDNGIRNSLLRNIELSPEDEGRAVEGCCVNAARREAEHEGYRVFFWREDKREVDVVLDKKNRLLPIEAKYRNSADESALFGLRRFMAKFGVAEALVVTKKHLEKKDGIYFIPFWLVD